MFYLNKRNCFFLLNICCRRLVAFNLLIRPRPLRLKNEGTDDLIIRLVADLVTPLPLEPLVGRPLKLESGGKGFLKSENSFDLCGLANGLESERYGELLVLKLRLECSMSSYLRGDIPYTIKHICKITRLRIFIW